MDILLIENDARRRIAAADRLAMAGHRVTLSSSVREAREILRLKSRLNEIMAHHTGQPIEVIERDTERDFYMSADAAVKYGLVDQVMEIPEIKRPVGNKNGAETKA